MNQFCTNAKETRPRERLSAQLTRYLATRGPANAAELCDHLRISQPAFSRLARGLDEALLVVGRARATRYAARRSIAAVGDRAPIYQIGCDDNTTRLLATLHAIEPAGFYVEPAQGGGPARLLRGPSLLPARPASGRLLGPA